METERKMATDLDFIDQNILEILQRDGRASHSTIAERVGLSQPSVHERVKKLEQRGVIQGYTAVLNPEALDLGVLAYISVRFSDWATKDAAAALETVPQVLETHHTAGEDCLLVKVRCRTPAELERVLDRIWKSGPVAGTRTTIAFRSYKETTVLPLEGCPDEPAEAKSA
jgi:Lrp/AsnC family leucine-responsive transcriptional regulator